MKIFSDELLKLASVNEWIFRRLWNRNNGAERRKLVLPKQSYDDHFPELMTIRVNEGQESVNTWIGNESIEFIFDSGGKVIGEDENHYRKTVNGTICYRLLPKAAGSI